MEKRFRNKISIIIIIITLAKKYLLCQKNYASFKYLLWIQERKRTSKRFEIKNRNIKI